MGENAIFIAPKFFGYEQDIANELDRHFTSVTYIDERPSNSPAFKSIARLLPKVAAAFADRYYRNALSSLEYHDCSLVLVIKAEILPRWFLLELRKRYPMAKLTYYSFDSISRTPNALGLFDIFDELFSFDPVDCANHQSLRLKHLFYTHEFAAARSSKRTIPVSFVGTLHSSRYGFVERLTRNSPHNVVHLYSPSRVQFFLGKYLTRRGSKVPWQRVSFKKISRGETARIFGASDVVLDLPRAGQSGLTIRTFEALAAGARLVTTNSFARDLDIFDDSWIQIINEFDDTEAIEVIEGKKSIVGIDRYSLENWILEFLNASGKKPAYLN